MNSPTIIWFDKCSLRRYKRRMVRTGILSTLLGTVVFGSSFIPDGQRFLVCLLCLHVGIPLFLIFLINLYYYIDAEVYLRRLKKNGYEVPTDRKDYGGKLEALPQTRDKVSVNQYASDSTIAALFSLGIYPIMIILDVFYYRTWCEYDPDSIYMFELILLALSIFPVMAINFFCQSSKDEYIDYVDINDGRHKVRSHLPASLCKLFIFAAIAGFGILCADSMTRYFYISRNTSERYNWRFLSTMEISSDDLKEEEWSSDLVTRTPSLSYEEVEGAEYYVIYMVDESEGCQVTWYVEHTNDTEFDTGSSAGVYRGITAHQDAPHRYSITVYALAGDPDSTLTIDPEQDSSPYPRDLYDDLNITDRSHNPPIFGNVLAYGYICGTY